MRFKKSTLVLIAVLAVLSAIAAVATFTLDNSIMEVPKGNASVVVTGDVSIKFGRKSFQTCGKCNWKCRFIITQF